MLESVVVSYLSKGDKQKLLPKNRMRKTTRQSNDRLYSKYTPAQVAKAYIQQARASWRAIEVLVSVSDKEGCDLIIEGHQIHPSLIAKLQRKYPKAIKAVVLTRFDGEKIVSEARKNKAKNDWFLQKTSNQAIHYKTADMIIVYSVFFSKEAKKHKIKRFDMDEHFHKHVESLASWFVGVKR